jgi:transposase
MIEVDLENGVIAGPHGSLALGDDDEIARKLLMLIEGECNGLGSQAAAEKYGYSRQRYNQLLHCFLEGGAAALASKKPGPKTKHKRTAEVERQVVGLLFMDTDSSASVIAQKLKQMGTPISVRSVQRIMSDHGLKKKPL